MPETKMPEPQPGPQPGRWVLSHGEIRTIVFGLMLAMFLAALNQTIVATALPTIGRDFRDFELLPWIVTAYLLSSTVVAPLYGKLSDIYGRRPMMLASIGIFVAGAAANPLQTTAEDEHDHVMRCGTGGGAGHEDTDAREHHGAPPVDVAELSVQRRDHGRTQQVCCNDPRQEFEIAKIAP